MDAMRVSLRCSELIFDQANKFFVERNYEKAVELYNFVIAITPTNVAAWINICEAKKEMGVQHDDYISVMRHMSETGQLNLNKIMSGELDAGEHKPEQPLPVPEDVKKCVELWISQKCIGENKIVAKCFAQSFVEEVFSSDKN